MEIRLKVCLSSGRPNLPVHQQAVWLGRGAAPPSNRLVRNGHRARGDLATPTSLSWLVFGLSPIPYEPVSQGQQPSCDLPDSLSTRLHPSRMDDFTMYKAVRGGHSSNGVRTRFVAVAYCPFSIADLA